MPIQRDTILQKTNSSMKNTGAHNSKVNSATRNQVHMSAANNNPTPGKGSKQKITNS